MRKPTLPPLREVIRRHGLQARKSLGQNYLLDLNLARAIARRAGPLTGRTIIEVGAGPGGLTRALLEEGAESVIAIERDRRFIPALEEIAQAEPHRLRILQADAVGLDLKTLTAKRPIRIAGNLPFNIAPALVTRWIGGVTWPPCFESLTVMVQEEVAQRMAAQAGGKVYGRLSVACQWRSSVQLLTKIPAAAFTPRPKVDGRLVRLEPSAPIRADIHPATLERLVAAAFSQRRKTLRNSLKTLSEKPLDLIEKANLNPALRAEQLSLKNFCDLAALLP